MTIAIGTIGLLEEIVKGGEIGKGVWINDGIHTVVFIMRNRFHGSYRGILFEMRVMMLLQGGGRGGKRWECIRIRVRTWMVVVVDCESGGSNNDRQRCAKGAQRSL